MAGRKQADREQIIGLAGEGLSARAISQIVGFSIQTVSGILSAAGIRPGRGESSSAAKGETITEWVRRMYATHGYQRFLSEQHADPKLWRRLREAFCIEPDEDLDGWYRLCPGAVRQHVRRS
jgi:transposase